MSNMTIVELELWQLVGKVLEFKREIVKDNDINLSEEIKQALLPWAEQLRDEAQELVDLIKKSNRRRLQTRVRYENELGHRTDEFGHAIKDPLCEVCKNDN